MVMKQESGQMKRPEIIIAEDSPTQAIQLKHMLESHNYIVHVAANGAECLKMVGKSKPAIIISDIIMPVMDGHELCRRIKQDLLLKDIDVILLTSLNEPQDIIKSLQCGADKFFTKPYDEELLISNVEQLLNQEIPYGREEPRNFEITYKGENYSMWLNHGQILNLLISTYEAAVKKNTELKAAQDDLNSLNRNLETMIMERTSELQRKNEELNTVYQQLWHAAKLAAIGELSASIAHELNNPLATITLHTDVMLSAAAEGSTERHSLDIIEQETERMARLIANLLQFSRRKAKQVSTLDICDEIDKTLELILYHLRKYGIVVTKQYEPGLPMIHFDRQELRDRKSVV